MGTETPDWSSYKPPGIDPCKWGHNTFFFCPPESCRCRQENDLAKGNPSLSAIVYEGRTLFEAAEKDWEFHDASKPFSAFATWCEDYFKLAIGVAERRVPPRTCEEAGDRCKHECTVNMATGEIKDPDCFR